MGTAIRIRKVEMIERANLSAVDLENPPSPFKIFDDWFALAKEHEPNDPNAMAIASIDPDGSPALRMVLLKQHNDDGFVFYTNYESRKGKALVESPKIAALFHWKCMLRQIRIEGIVEPVEDATADDYYHSRSRESQIGAWASKQSRPLDHRTTLLERVERFEQLFDGWDVPRPPQWSGFRIVPKRFEFWQQQPSRLHDRLIFERPAAGDAWELSRLFP